MSSRARSNGLIAALLTAVLMGSTPIFGKLAIHSGFDPFTLSALRTSLAAVTLWIVYLLFFRQYIYIFPAGLLSTAAVGVINGLGSLLFYNGLLMLDNASLAQLLNMLYVIFTVLLVRMYGQSISALSLARAGLAVVAVCLLTLGAPDQGPLHWIGVGLMIGSAFTYALHVVVSQRAMFEMPAPTMALYALTWMSITVIAARLIYGAFLPLPIGPTVFDGWYYVVGLMAVTALSRVTLFSGVREIGSLQTMLIHVAEIAVTLIAAGALLGERMSLVQWIGVIILMASVLLARWDQDFKGLPFRSLSFTAAGRRLPPFIDPPDPNA
jgi:drug/metabolite transporter (DMT)-like permease